MTVNDEPATSSAEALIDGVEAVLDGHRFGHAVPEEHHVRLERARAPNAGRHPEAGRVVELDVAVRRGDQVQVISESGVEFVQAALQLEARCDLAAVQADHLIHPAVQVDHPAAAGQLVQTVDVLRDPDSLTYPALSRAASARWPRFGIAVPIRVPSEMTSGPISLLGDRTGAELTRWSSVCAPLNLARGSPESRNRSTSPAPVSTTTDPPATRSTVAAKALSSWVLGIGESPSGRG